MGNKQTVKEYPPGKAGLIGITMGCPAGIGPEIILRLAARRKGSERFMPVVVGDTGLLQRVAQELRLDVVIEPWHPGEAIDRKKVQVVEPDPASGYALNSDTLQWGVPGRETGLAAGAYIKKAVDLIHQGIFDAMVTCPISKHAMQSAGFNHPAHTEMLASLCNVKNYGMMMAGEKLRVSLVTIHTPLAEVPKQLSQVEIKRVINLTGETLVRDFAVPAPRIAVAGLNPHSGEAGLMGREEEFLIEPSVKEVGAGKWQVHGPLPPDTVFMQALAGKYDAVVAMYHDQGLIPFKLVHFADGVNVTMGLPLVRTSVDHGTAYDIAGKGIAADTSLAAAFTMAAAIVVNRQKHGRP